MVNYREVLRLNNLGYTQRQIATSIQSSRDTISAVCKLAEQHGLEWPLPDELSNQAIQDITKVTMRISRKPSSPFYFTAYTPSPRT